MERLCFDKNIAAERTTGAAFGVIEVCFSLRGRVLPEKVRSKAPAVSIDARERTRPTWGRWLSVMRLLTLTLDCTVTRQLLA